MGKTEQIKDLPEAIGPYSIVESLGKGGMGEVFLAQDPVCGRNIAIKRIRPELKANKIIQNRFLREAQVASVLSHPSIVPILALQISPPDIYYTMPFVAGDTLRQILKSTKDKKNGAEGSDSIGDSIPALARIFLQVCEAVAYTHSKGILHRDLKPENIIIGNYGEVMILDWGIADFIEQLNKEKPLPALKIADGADLTRPGKITGTLAYMAPERLVGKSSSTQTDIYALGVILYQMLTLQLPFIRKTVAAFRKQVDFEEFIDPIEMAPYRDIPHQMSKICHKCLSKNPAERYQSVEELIREIKSYIEGKSQWILASSLDKENKEDWLFQENILLAKNIAITRSLDITEWAELMISKRVFAGHMRVETRIRLGEKGQGLGFLLSVPGEKIQVEVGYCLWISHNSCKLFRNNVQVMEAQILQPKTWHHISIEKVDDHLKLFVDGILKLKFDSYLPLAGNRVGLLVKDNDFELTDLQVYDGSHNITVGCLAVPNAFLSHKLYDVALDEYRRIAQCFPGRTEGREALFRAGLTLLEKAKSSSDESFYHSALKEFEKLCKTPGAPLEYLGKSLVYEALGDNEEESKCLELALRKFPGHPLLPMLKEHIVYRMHKCSLKNREAAYRIILLAVRHIPDLLKNPDTSHLIESLEKNWEIPPFIEKCEDRLSSIAIQLAFWLAKVPILVEIAQSVKNNEPLLNNALVCLQELEAKESLKKFLPHKPRKKRALVVWNLLLQGKLAEAKAIFERYSKSIKDETSPLHFAYGTYLYMTKGQDEATKHFGAVLETPHPPTTALPSLFLTSRLKRWMEHAFWWEKKELHRQVELFYKCVGGK